MRIEYTFGLNQVDVPRFSVEATEGPQKLFTLATLVLNVLSAGERVELVFHSANPDEPHRKIEAFERILQSSPEKTALDFEEGESGRLSGVYFRWLSIRSSDDGAGG